MSEATREKPERRRRSDGERSRAAILREAAQLATVEGIDGLSIGHLADAVGMSKSGLFAHFKSKEELQLATIETASDDLRRARRRAGAWPRPPARALPGAAANVPARTSRSDVFPGGCFFASVAAELDTRPGPVRDRDRRGLRRLDYADCSDGLGRSASWDCSLDPEQIAFEANAMLAEANGLFLLRRGTCTPSSSAPGDPRAAG